MLLSTVSAIGILIYSGYIYKKPLISDRAQKKQLIEDSRLKSFIPPIKLDKLIINLSSKRSKLKFLDIQIHALAFEAATADTIPGVQAQINDAIIQVASRMSPPELNSITGKMLLENRLIKRINKILGGKKIKDLYFTKFVIQ